MSCLLIGLISVICYFVTALIVTIAASLFGFTFSWGIVTGVFAIFVLLKLLF